MPETPDHRTRRLLQLCEAIQPHLDEDWRFVLIIGKPGDAESTNVVSNLRPPKQVLELLKVIVDRYAKGFNPTEL